MLYGGTPATTTPAYAAYLDRLNEQSEREASIDVDGSRYVVARAEAVA